MSVSPGLSSVALLLNGDGRPSYSGVMLLLKGDGLGSPSYTGKDAGRTRGGSH